MVRRIVFTSGKGGVGKTTVAALMGRALAKKGYRVVLVDLDFGLNNLDMALRKEHLVSYDLADVVEGRCRLKQALIVDEKTPNLLFLPSKRAYVTESVSAQKIRAAVEGLKPYADFILFDCPAGMDIGFHRAVSCANEGIVVVTPSPLAVRDADKVIALLRSYGITAPKVAVNRVRGELVAAGDMLSPLSVCKLLKAEPVCVLPEDESLLLGGEGSASLKKAVKIGVENLLKGEFRAYDPTRKYRGFWGSIRRKIKRSV